MVFWNTVFTGEDQDKRLGIILTALIGDRPELMDLL